MVGQQPRQWSPALADLERQREAHVIIAQMARKKCDTEKDTK
jgi:hypothetical protein